MRLITTGTLKRSTNLGNWYFLTPNDGQGTPEGPAYEFRDIITCLRERREYNGGMRVAFIFVPSGDAVFYSPRNSNGSYSCRVAADSIDEEAARWERLLNFNLEADKAAEQSS